jgi:hypothetical protein
MRTVATHAVWQRGWKTTGNLNGCIDKPRKAEKLTDKASVGDGEKKVKIPWMIRVVHYKYRMLMCPQNCPTGRSDAFFVVHMALW